MRTITYWLSLVMIFVIPWENIVNIEGVGTISRVIGLLVAVFWALLVVSTNGFRKPRAFHVAVFVFFLWNALSILWSINIDSTLASSITYLQLGVMALILWDLFTTPAALRAGFQAYVLGAYVSIGSVIGNYQAGVSVVDSVGRFSAIGFNPNDVAMILALGMPVAWHLAVSEGSGSKTWLLRLINFAYAPAALFAILLTASRAGFLSTVAVFLFMIASLTSLKIHLRVLLLVALIGSLFALQPLVPETSIQRLGRTGTDIAQDNRLRTWREGITIFLEHPILGVGSGSNTFRTAAVETRTVAHNSAIALLVQIGIIGLGLFATILAITVYYCRVLPKAHSRLWLTILVIWLLSAATHNPEHAKQTWLFLSLAVVNASLFVRRRETRLTTITGFPLDSSELTRTRRSPRTTYTRP